MLTAFTDLQRDLQNRINILSRDPGAGLARIEKILIHIDQALVSVKMLLENYTFESQAEEITFFKEINPEFYAHWVYFSTVYSIQEHTFPASSKQRLKYLDHELKKIDDFFFHHIDFYKYFRAGRTHRDEEFFTRRTEFRYFSIDVLAPVMDRQFCTAHSLKLATLLANERLKVYINDAISGELNPRHISVHEPPLPSMQWTATKTGLCELIYAWYAGKVFNNGDATLDSITRHCEKIFGVELGAQTVTFQEILRRKKGPSTFIDWLKNKYLIYIDKIDEGAFRKNVGK